MVAFYDNYQIIETIENNIGLLALLDESTLVGQNDEVLSNKIASHFSNN